MNSHKNRSLYLSVLLLLPSATSLARHVEELVILSGDYPRVFFFRSAEQAYNTRRFPSYESWERQFDRLQGIIGKCLDEECLGREKRNPDFFSRFKTKHPRQAVLLHFNGNARDPRYRTENYFPGHWVYRRATLITRDIPAEAGETVIHVEDASDFRAGSGRYKTSNDDIALFAMTADGKHDWNRCEQVRLLEVDVKQNTIKVQRGCYGTTPIRLAAGKSRAAAHQVEGPWGKPNNLMWFYNFATHCPRDHEGKTCGDRLADDLCQWFSPDELLASFDGLEFDVLHHQTHGDTNGDGHEDHGVVDGRNEYGIGVVQFAQQLRSRMTDNFIIQADGALGPGGVRSQRAFGIMNGIESEGFPNLGDWEFDDWSGGLNRHFFWRDNARKPVFNYVNHKWNQSVPGQPGIRKNADVPFSRHRLSFAACQFFDAMTCHSFAPPNDPDGLFGIWDEMRCGVDNKVGWLVRPEGPAVRIAAESRDLFNGRGETDRLKTLITGDVMSSITSEGLKIWPRDSSAMNLTFSVREVPTDGVNLVIAVEMLGDPMTGYPKDVARFATIGASGGITDLMAREPTSVGIRLRGESEVIELDRASGASCRKGTSEIDGVSLAAYSVHPPYKSGKGYTFWTQRAWVPEGSELRFSLGMGERSPHRSDGVQFEVRAAIIQDDTVGQEKDVFRHTTNEHCWQPQRVSLESFGNQRVQFKFVADCGPNNNATTDHAKWGDVKIVPAGATDAQITPEKRHMTWVNDRPFRSHFFYHHIRSPNVTLNFQVEGPEPIVLRKLAAHAAPDVMYRVFERGIVLANPSRDAYTFDLQSLTPGRRYRRIQATPRQDTVTNNGQSVAGKVTLGERDALFLIRER